MCELYSEEYQFGVVRSSFMFQPLLVDVFSVKKVSFCYLVLGLAETDEICLYRVAIFLDL
jgi:hypothetical protein